MAVVAGAAHHKDGEDEMEAECDFMSLALSAATHLTIENSVETSLLGTNMNCL